MYLHRTPWLVKRMFPQYLWSLPGKDRKLYLTFDDGPVPGVTDFVLKTLSRQQVPATFFCVGDNIRKYPEVFREVLNNGHQVGNHTFSHLDGWRTDDTAYRENINRCQDLISKHTGRAEDYQAAKALFRPPYGKISREQGRGLKATHRIVMWDVLAGDFDRNLHPRQCLQRTVASIRPGSIVLFHDSLKAERTMRYVLPRFIEKAKDLGYSFERLNA